MDKRVKYCHGLWKVQELRFFFFFPYWYTHASYTREWEANNHYAKLQQLL